MTRSFRFRRLALVAAGCLAAVGPALAAPAPAPAPPAPPAQAVAPVSEAQRRLDEMQIESAWMADPLTCPYQIVALSEGPAMMIYGDVPDNVVAAQALQAAREHTSLNVVDFLQLRPSLRPGPKPESAEALQKAAERALVVSFPGYAQRLAVRADAAGRITLTGNLPSCEDRRNVGRRLKQVRGCTAVVNQAEVTPVVRMGQSSIQVSSDGRLQVTAPAEQPRPETPPAPSPARTTVGRSPYATVPTPVLNAAVSRQSGVQRAGFFQRTPAAPVLPAAAQAPAPPQNAAAGQAAQQQQKQASPLKLKRQIERSCGMAAREVQVTNSPDGGLHVRVKVRTEEEGQRLFDKLMQLPELAPYQVQFLVQVER